MASPATSNADKKRPALDHLREPQPNKRARGARIRGSSHPRRAGATLISPAPGDPTNVRPLIESEVPDSTAGDGTGGAGTPFSEEARCTKDSMLFFGPADAVLAFDRGFEKPVKGKEALQILVRGLKGVDVGYQKKLLKKGVVYTELAAMDFKKPIQFFHAIKIILHDKRLQDTNVPAQALRETLRQLMAPCMDNNKSTSDLSEYTEAGTDLVQNWVWNSADWEKTAPIIMAAFVVAGAEQDRDLQRFMIDERKFYLCCAKSGKWGVTVDVQASEQLEHGRAFKLTKSRTTEAYEIAKEIWKKRLRAEKKARNLRNHEATIRQVVQSRRMYGPFPGDGDWPWWNEQRYARYHHNPRGRRI